MAAADGVRSFGPLLSPIRTSEALARLPVHGGGPSDCQPGAQVFLAGPYALDFRFVQDPTHTLPVNEATFYYWDKLGAPVLWEVYQQPVFHVIRFERIPVGNGVDYNASLQCCKDPKTCETCVANAKAVRAAEKGAKR